MTVHPRYISVDCEFDGPAPGKYSMLAFGAVTVDPPHSEFYCELKPISDNFVYENVRLLETAGYWRNILKREGEEPEAAMAGFAHWMVRVCRANEYPVLVEYPGGIDFSWIHWYFVNFYNDKPPIGWTSLSVRSYYMGAMGCNWENASKDRWPSYLKPDKKEFPHTHNPLDDAKEQAEMFRLIRAFRRKKGPIAKW